MNPESTWPRIGRRVWRLARFGGVVLAAALRYAGSRTVRASLPARAAWLQDTARRTLSVLHVHVDVSGRLPRGALLTPNHLGYLDIVVLAAVMPATFVAKSDVRGWPVFGWFARQAGTRFIRREAKQDLLRVNRELDSVIAQGLNLVVFLEGTSSDGCEVLRFRSSLLAPAIASGWSVIPAAIGYDVPRPYSVPHDIAWWGDMTLLPHLWRLSGIPQTRAIVQLGPPRVATGDRKVLAEALWQDVVDLRGKRLAAV